MGEFTENKQYFIKLNSDNTAIKYDKTKFVKFLRTKNLEQLAIIEQ